MASASKFSICCILLFLLPLCRSSCSVPSWLALRMCWFADSFCICGPKVMGNLACANLWKCCAAVASIRWKGIRKCNVWPHLRQDCGIQSTTMRQTRQSVAVLRAITMSLRNTCKFKTKLNMCTQNGSNTNSWECENSYARKNHLLKSDDSLTLLRKSMRAVQWIF